MIRNKLKMILSNEEGSGLVLALMVLLVLSVLGASLGVVTIGSLQLSDANRDSNSAYYIAEAGANMAYEEFEKDIERSHVASINNTNSTDSAVIRYTSFFTEIDAKVQNIESPYRKYGIDDTDDFETQFGDTPTATVVVKLVSDDSDDSEEVRDYIIKSTGEVGKKKRTVAKIVSVQWKDPSPVGGSLGIPTNAMAIVKDNLETNKNSVINGYVYVKGKLSKDYLNGEWVKKDVEDEKASFNESTFTQLTDGVNNLANQYNTITDYKTELEDNKVLEGYYKIDELKLDGNNYILEIGRNEVTIFTKKLLLDSANVIIKGTGSLTIVVSDTSNKVKIGANADFNSPDLNGKDSANVRIIYTAKSAKGIDIDGSGKIYAQIIAPFHEVVIKNEGTVYGSIVSKTLEVKNKSHLYYHPFKFNNSGTGESEDDGGYFITPEPAIESD